MWYRGRYGERGEGKVWEWHNAKAIIVMCRRQSDVGISECNTHNSTHENNPCDNKNNAGNSDFTCKICDCHSSIDKKSGNAGCDPVTDVLRAAGYLPNAGNC